MSVSTFNRSILPNGIRVVSENIPSVRSIAVGVWIHTGSRDEKLDESGISHFIEHMVFKGTARRRMHQIAQRMEAVGGYLNAFTGKEYTCYFARALDEHLGRSIETISDLLLEPSFPVKQLQLEKDVVLEEMKMYQDTPEDAIYDRFESVIYNGHSLARPVIGTEDTVSSFQQDQLFNYLNQHYTPDQIVVSAAGNLSHEEVIAKTEKAFAGIARPRIAHPREKVNGYKVDDAVEHRPIQQAHLLLGTRSYDIYNPKRIALTVFNVLLGGGMSSRLNQNIREKYGYCYNIYSFINMHSDTGDFGIYVGTDPSKIEKVKKLIFKELELLLKKPMGKRLLQQAINQVKGSIMLGLESMSNRMMRLGRQELYYQNHFTLDHSIKQVEAVTPDEITEVAVDLLQPDQMSTIVLLPMN